MIETSRLLLRPPTIDDAGFLLRLVNEPSWLQYIGDRNVHSLEEAENYLLNGSIRSYNERGFGFDIVILKSSEAPIGMVGLVKRDFLDHVDLGFAFVPEHTGQGYAFEAANAMMHHAFHNLGLEKLAAITSPDNERSIRLLKKLGFSLEITITVDSDELLLFERT